MELNPQNSPKECCVETEVIHNYDEALSKVGLGRFHALLLLTTGLCLMTAIIETLSIGFVIPLIESECDLKLSLSDKGILNGAAFAGVVISSYLWGFLADTRGRHRVMHLCTSISFIFSILSSFSFHVWMLIITRFLVGFFISGIAANTYAYLGEFHCEKNRAKQLNFAGVFMAFALIFCPGIAWLILEFQNVASLSLSFTIPLINMNYSIWRIFLLLCSLPSAVIIVLLYFLPESPKFLLAQNNHDEAIAILKKIFRSNKQSSTEVFPVKTIDLNELIVVKSLQGLSLLKLIKQQTFPLFMPPLLINTVRTSFLMFCFFAASSGFFMWTPDILQQLQNYRQQEFSVCQVTDDIVKKRLSASHVECQIAAVDQSVYEITFLMGVFFSVVYFLHGIIINKVGKKNLLALWFLISGIAGALIPWTGHYYTILILMMLFLTCGVCGAILSAIIVDLFPTNVRAISLCVTLMTGRIGAVAGSVFVSFMITRECELMFGLFGFFLLVSAVVSVFLPVNLK